MPFMRLIRTTISGRSLLSLRPCTNSPRVHLACPLSAAAFRRAPHRLLRTAAGNSGRLYILDMLPFAHRCVASAAKDPINEISAQVAASTALQDDRMTSSKSAAPGLAAHKFVELLVDLLSKTDGPTHVAAVVDGPGQMNFRHQMLPTYKGHRKEKPPNLHEELSRMLVLLESMGIPVLCVPGIEADDVCGALAVHAIKAGFEVVLVSPDKDFNQLLQPGLALLRSTKSGPQLYTHQMWAQEFNLPADQAHLWVDVRALSGDPGDNIPGVKGIGMLTALQLVREFGSVEQILEVVRNGQVQELAQGPVKLTKSQEKMLSSPDGRAAAMFCKKLISIVTETKLPPLRQPLEESQLDLSPEKGREVVEMAKSMQLHWSAIRLDRFYRDNTVGL